MKGRLLVLAAVSLLPLTQVEAQRRSRSDRDSSATAYHALGAAAGLGGGLLSLLGSRSSDYDGSADGWCVGSCGTTTRNGFGLFLNSGSNQGNARGGVSSLLRVAPARRAMLLETLDDALARAGLRLVGGSGNRVWFGTDGTNRAFDRLRSDLATTEAGNGSFGGTGLRAAGTATDAPPSGGSTPSNGCIIASCMLGEGSSGGGSVVGNATAGSALVLDGSPESLFRSSPPAQSLATDVNVIVNPEPGTVVLMVGGLAGLALLRRRTRRA
jgi:hypothetical protein